MKGKVKEKEKETKRKSKIGEGREGSRQTHEQELTRRTMTDHSLSHPRV